jgi:RNA polymerase sigma factor (sigma-70 family)
MYQLRRLAGTQEVRNQSDQALLRRIVESNDEAAFEALLWRHGPMVLAVCRRVLGNDADAEDAFQATFLVLARKSALIRKKSSVGSWLHGIALRVSLRARAASARRRVREQQAPIRNADAGQAELRELAAMLDDEVSRLPAKYRDPLVLCYLEGLTRAEAAAQLGWCLRTFMRRIEQGRELLRRRLIRRGFTLSAMLCASALGENLAAAPVPAALLAATVRHTFPAVAGAAATAAVPAHITALADGLARTMAVKSKIALLLVLSAVGAVVAAFGLSRRDDPASSSFPSNGQKTQAQKVAPLRLQARPQPDQARPPDARAGHGWNGIRIGGPVSSLVFADNGKLLASADDGDRGSIRLWDTTTGKERYSIHVNSPVFALAASRTGHLLAAAGQDRLIRLCDVRTGKSLGSLRGHENAVYSLVFAHDGKTLFSGDFAATVRAWRRDGSVTQLYADSPAGFAGTARVWDTVNRKLVATLSLPGQAVHSLVLSPDGKTLAAACQAFGQAYHPIRLWNTATLQERVPIARAHTGPVFALAFATDGTLASAGSDGFVRLWNAASGRLVRELSWGDTFASPVQALAFSPLDGTLVGGCLDTRLCAWNPATGRLLWSRQAHPAGSPGRKYAQIDSFHGTTAVAFSPDGTTLVSGGSDQWLRAWHGATGKERN